jgi:hypothetical protein
LLGEKLAHKTEAEWHQIRLKIAIELLSEPKQTVLSAELFEGICQEDPFVANVLSFYGVAV